MVNPPMLMLRSLPEDMAPVGVGLPPVTVAFPPYPLPPDPGLVELPPVQGVWAGLIALPGCQSRIPSSLSANVTLLILRLTQFCGAARVTLSLQMAVPLGVKKTLPPVLL